MGSATDAQNDLAVAAVSPVLLGRSDAGAPAILEAASSTSPCGPSVDAASSAGTYEPNRDLQGAATSCDLSSCAPAACRTACTAGLDSPFVLREVVGGITVALAMVPEAVAFALSANLPPSLGLVSSFIICILTTLFGGRPAMVSGATGSIAALIGPIVSEHGPEYLFCAVMLMGLIQIFLGLVGAGNLVRLMPASVEIGFANGLAIVIALSQLNSYKLPGHEHHAEGGAHAPEVFKPLVDGAPWEQGMSGVFAGIITALSFFISILLPYMTKRVPSALMGIAVSTLFEWAVVRAAFGCHTTLVVDLGSARGSFPTPAWFQAQYTMPSPSGSVLGAIYKLSATMAVVGLLESAMTVSLINERTKTKGNVRRECVGQGIANIVCGLCGGMGGCAMLGQSMINVSSGARTRLSTFACSLSLLCVLLVAYPAINVLPVAALSGVMFNVVFQTFEWASLKLLLVAALPRCLRQRLLSEDGGQLKKIRRADAVVIIVVTVMTLLTDLAVAVGCGFALACFMHVYDSATMIGAASQVQRDSEGKATVKIYDVSGVLFFGSVGAFLELFEPESDPEEVCLIFESSYISDYSALEALNKLGERYGALGKRVTLRLLHTGSSRIVDEASNLLVKELTLASEGERVLNSPRFRHHIESYQQSFVVSRSASDGESVMEQQKPGETHSARRRSTALPEAKSSSSLPF